jgi:large subunit ribosomal protein L15
MKLNQLHPAKGSRKPINRVGRGIGSGSGKTCGRGTKGQYARNTVPAGFEGGQMPLFRRIPKSGFSSWRAIYRAEVRLSDLAMLSDNVITLDLLKQQKIINNKIRYVKVIATGEITKPVVIQGLVVTAGAKKAIEAAGGKVESAIEQAAQ